MIVKEIYRTEDNRILYRTYSDTEHKIRNIKTNDIYVDAIDIDEDVEYEEVEDYIELDGPETYDEIAPLIDTIKHATKKINRINLTDNESLSVKELYPSWDSKIGKNVEAGYKLLYNDNLWRVKQNHLVQEIYPPSLSTASLYEVINYQHEGTIEDPIPYIPPMEIFKDKYYIQNNVIYKCTRDSGTALSHDLSALIGIYVEIVEKNK